MSTGEDAQEYSQQRFWLIIFGFLGDREVVEYKMNKQKPSSQKRKWKEDGFHELERGHPPLSWA